MPTQKILALVMLASSLTGYAEETFPFCQNLLMRIHTDQNGEDVRLLKPGSPLFKSLIAGDILKIDYRSGASETIVVRVERFNQSTGQGFGGAQLDRVYFPLMIEGELHQVLVTNELLKRIQGITFLGNLSTKEMPAKYTHHRGRQTRAYFFEAPQ